MKIITGLFFFKILLRTTNKVLPDNNQRQRSCRSCVLVVLFLLFPTGPGVLADLPDAVGSVAPSLALPISLPAGVQDVLTLNNAGNSVIAWCSREYR